ncbi:MAG TPA: hypothetical protein VHG72_03770 [Polyangia bacterium]|nr:hypothetical protein [Polyangia bacterium]
MSGVLMTPARDRPTNRSRAVYDSVPQPQWEARLADYIRYISTPSTPGPFDLKTLGLAIPAIEYGRILALPHAPAAKNDIVSLFADVRKRAETASFELPSYFVIARAADWVRLLEQLASEWSLPHVSSSPDGEIVLEWWRDPRKLTVYISDGGAEFIRSWGSSIRNDMAEGTANSVGEALTIWNWLIRG